MIKIVVNGSAIELLPDTSITLHFQSPIFNEEGTFSLPINISNSINNRRILNFPARVGNMGAQPLSYECEIQANSFRLKGLLIVTSATTTRIEAYYTDGIGHLNYLLNDKYLTDIIDPDAPVLPTVASYFGYLMESVLYSYPTRRIACFPHKNLALFDGTKQETTWRAFGGEINAWDPVSSTFKSYVNEYNIPHFYLCHILMRMMSTFGFTLNDNFFYDHPDLRQLVIMSDFYKNQDWILIEDHHANDFVLNPAWYLPKYLIKSFINDLRSAFFCEFFVNNRSKQVDIKSLKQILTSPDYVDITDKADKEYEIEFEDEADGYDFGYEKDDADEQLSDIIDVDEYDRIDDVDTRDDLPAYTGPATYDHENEICLVRDENTFWCWCNDIITGFRWVLLTYNFNHKLSGSGDLQRTSSSAYPKMAIRTTQLIPVMDVKAFDLPDHPLKDSGGVYYKLLDSFIAQNKPKLVFYHGLVQMYPQDPGHQYYPFASGDYYYTDVYSVYRKVTGKTVSLVMDGEGGLFENFGQEFAFWWYNRKKSTIWKINWSTIDLHNLDFSKKYRINNQNYLVKAVEVTINANGNLEVGDTDLVVT